MNIRFNKRMSNLRDVGYFPIIEKDALMSLADHRLVKLAIYSKCLTFLLKDMKTVSFEGEIQAH